METNEIVILVLSIVVFAGVFFIKSRKHQNRHRFRRREEREEEDRS